MAKRKKSKRADVARRKNKNTQKPLHYSVVGLILIAAAVIFGVILYTSGPGALSGILRQVLFSVFSVSAYLIPPILLALAIYVFKVQNSDKLSVKLFLSILGCFFTSALYQLFTTRALLDYSALIDYSLDGGGLVGGSIANVLYYLTGKAIAIIILILLLIADISIILKISLFNAGTAFISGLFRIKDEIKEVNYKDSYESGKKAAEKVTNLSGRKKIDFEVDDQQSAKKKKKSVVSKDDLQVRIDEIVFNPDIPISDEKNEEQENDEDISLGVSLDDLKNETDVQRGGGAKKVSATTDEEKAEIKGEIDSSIEQEEIKYVFPPINLLKKAPASSADKRREMQETASKLMEILRNFGVEAKLLQVTQGPTVTRYEIQPHTGIKLSKITGLAEDIALNLAVPTVLVAAVPGKAAVGIEVPNTTVNTVSVRELIESPKFKDATSKLTVAFGKDIGGNVVVGDIAKMPHVLIAGATGSGKSVCINTIIASILYKANPNEVKLIMVDPKVVELGVYNGIPHLLVPVVTDPKRAAGSLNWAVGEMMRRYALFAESATRNLTGYNELMERDGKPKLPQIVIIIDELADLMMVAAKEVEDYICRLAQLARAAGIHLIIATQRPSVDVITGLIKANVPSRIAFSTSSQVDSRTILDKGGAEKLLGKGDMLYHPTGLSQPLRVQGAFISDGEVENIVTFIKEHCEVTHYSQEVEEHLDKIASGDISSEESADEFDGDELLPEAIQLASELGQISTAMIQRRLKVGYARAGRIIDQMEQRGIISGANGSKPREVYLNRIDMSEFE